MATSKTVTVSMQVQNNATSPSAVSYTAEAEVRDGNLVAGHLRTNPGVFTAGTPSQNYGGANPNSDVIN